jgi:hypothetical protein
MNGIDGRDVPFGAQETRNDMRQIRDRVIKFSGSRCHVCEFDCADILVVHHIRAVAEGGTNSENNLTVLCPNCHALIHKIQELRLKVLGGDETGQMERVSQWISQNFSGDQEDKLMEVCP